MLLGIPPLPTPTTLLAALLDVYSMAIVSVSSWILDDARPLSWNSYGHNADRLLTTTPWLPNIEHRCGGRSCRGV